MGRAVHISIHAPHTGRDENEKVQMDSPKKFQSTRPIRGATQAKSDRIAAEQFQSTRPIRGATDGTHRLEQKVKDFNPRAPYGARQVRIIKAHQSPIISIHAPHTGRDWRSSAMWSRLFDFNPRAPYGARRLQQQAIEEMDGISIHAPHTGRDEVAIPLRVLCEISIHAPHTGRDAHRGLQKRPAQISIHAPHTGRDDKAANKRQFLIKFQSTRPIRGATPQLQAAQRLLRISIHAPHTGRDLYEERSKGTLF